MKCIDLWSVWHRKFIESKHLREIMKKKLHRSSQSTEHPFFTSIDRSIDEKFTFNRFFPLRHLFVVVDFLCAINSKSVFALRCFMSTSLFIKICIVHLQIHKMPLVFSSFFLYNFFRFFWSYFFPFPTRECISPKEYFQNKWRLNSRVYCVCHMHSLLVTVISHVFFFLLFFVSRSPVLRAACFCCCCSLSAYFNAATITVTQKKYSGPRRFKYTTLKRRRKTRWISTVNTNWSDYDSEKEEKRRHTEEKEHFFIHEHEHRLKTAVVTARIAHWCMSAVDQQCCKDFTFIRICLLSQFR